MICDRCALELDDEDAHTLHDRGCDRFINGFCRCPRVSCLDCCREKDCGPLAARLKAANDLPHTPTRLPLSVRNPRAC